MLLDLHVKKHARGEFLHRNLYPPLSFFFLPA